MKVYTTDGSTRPEVQVHGITQNSNTKTLNYSKLGTIWKITLVDMVRHVADIFRFSTADGISAVGKYRFLKARRTA